MTLSIKKVLVSQPKPETEKSPYFDIAEKFGVTIDFRPFIKIDGVGAKEFRAQRVNILDYTAVIFTAKTSIDHFFRLCEEMRVQISESMKYFCVTEAIAVYLQKYIIYRKRKIFFSATGKIEDLMTPICKHNKENYIVPVSDIHKENLIILLEDKKVQYSKAVMYKTVSTDFSSDPEFDYDMLVFFSPAGISSLKKNFPEFQQNNIKIGCFGASTAKAVKDAGLRLDIEAPNKEASSMAAALENYFKKHHVVHEHEKIENAVHVQ
ncbi:uroporphyrinogen III methyltransferase [Bacteroidales bacterium]|nr:uroporphyrinogen III methyltransferase [Bacteroidales bacterium]